MRDNSISKQRYSINPRQGYSQLQKLRTKNDSVGKKSLEASLNHEQRSEKSQTFGNYLSNKKFVKTPLIKLNKSNNNSKQLLFKIPKYSSSTNDMKLQTLSKVLKEVKKYKKVDQIASSNSSSKTSAKNLSNSSSILQNNQFQGYFMSSNTGNKIKER